MSVCYYTHWNGGNPYIVLIDESKQTVTIESTDVHKIKTFPYEKVWIGKNPNDEHNENDGNTILFQESNRDGLYYYVYIGSNVYRFTTCSPMKSYSSPIGNADCPYPFSIDEDNVYYLLQEKVTLDMKDPYRVFYGTRPIRDGIVSRKKTHGEPIEMTRLDI